MSENEERLFENFPRQSLPIPVSRAKLPVAVAVELGAQSRKLGGERVLQLADLGTCPNEELRTIVPCILEGSTITIKNGYVVGKSSMTGKTYRLFAINSPALKIFNQINGTCTLEEINRVFEEETDWEAERCFNYTRGVFLSLIVAGLCAPRD